MDFKSWFNVSNKNKLVLVSVPHSQSNLPQELLTLANKNQWRATFPLVERYTDDLYNFGDILNSKQVVFPYNRFYIDENRCPQMLNEATPLYNTRKKEYNSIYDIFPDNYLRKNIIKKYHQAYHDCISKEDKWLIFDGHSMLSDEPDKDGINNDARINVYTWQDPLGVNKTCPDEFVEFYVKKLNAYLPNIKIAINPKKFQTTYGHIMATHGLNGTGLAQFPLIMQETDEKLYLKNNKLDVDMLNKLRMAFGKSLNSLTNEF